ncbi:unnamed protein product [Mesocestoides corti]|uniref:SCP domain-containing protein n=1 Tax=Mesocestoides corti TaxID=53468 RepID=A0A0R3U5K2_MESCO|nr:unnamed protein product [Mesocestoides corti]
MERLAFDWVRRCRNEHPDPEIYPQFKGTGQNLALMQIDSPDWVTMAQIWYDEMVWATSHEVGCAAYRCDSLNPEWNPPAYLLACQYKPQGNFVGTRPYESGRSCSRCPEGSVCERNLCVTRPPDTHERPADSENPTDSEKPIDRTRPSARCLPRRLGRAPLDP